MTKVEKKYFVMRLRDCEILESSNSQQNIIEKAKHRAVDDPNESFLVTKALYLAEAIGVSVEAIP